MVGNCLVIFLLSSSLILLWSENTLWIISVLWNLLRLAFTRHVVNFGKCAVCIWNKGIICHCWVHCSPSGQVCSMCSDFLYPFQVFVTCLLVIVQKFWFLHYGYGFALFFSSVNLYLHILKLNYCMYLNLELLFLLCGLTLYHYKICLFKAVALLEMESLLLV